MMNIGKMMQQAKVMQEKMKEVQDRLGEIEVQGSAGGGAVNVTLTCKGECRGIEIDPSILKADEKEIVEDMVQAAINDAKAKGDIKVQEETAKVMAEMGLPANAQLPF